VWFREHELPYIIIIVLGDNIFKIINMNTQIAEIAHDRIS